MFMPNPAVNLPGTGKPLPLNGAWGFQSQFPDGPPKACLQARVPCVKVVYRVPEAQIVCDWTLAVITVIEPQHDGSIQHVTRPILLDENDAAALYTLRKAWLRGETAPEPVASVTPEYPSVARSNRIGGVVSVRLLIGPDGTVGNATANSGPAMLQQAVLTAVRKWKFDPLAIGHQATSFQVDEQFNYDPGKSNTMAGMGTGGVTYTLQSDPRLGTSGMVGQGASSGSWASCNAATGCVFGAPAVPK
jgi:TonB family protein